MERKNIYLIRHTKTYNPERICFGQSEMPLEENFTAHFDWIKERLNLSPQTTTYYSSPLRRCTKLGNYLSDEKFTPDQRISDLDYGAWEMKEWNKIAPKELNAWQEDFVNYKIKNGERFLDFYERAVDFYEEIISGCESENIVVITHAGAIRSILAYILDFPVAKVFNLRIDFSSISKIEYHLTNESSNVAFVNITAAHLKTNVKEEINQF